MSVPHPARNPLPVHLEELGDLAVRPPPDHDQPDHGPDRRGQGPQRSQRPFGAFSLQARLGFSRIAVPDPAVGALQERSYELAVEEGFRILWTGPPKLPRRVGRHLEEQLLGIVPAIPGEVQGSLVQFIQVPGNDLLEGRFRARVTFV
jgi:hypothetical protein